MNEYHKIYYVIVNTFPPREPFQVYDSFEDLVEAVTKDDIWRLKPHEPVMSGMYVYEVIHNYSQTIDGYVYKINMVRQNE